MSKPPNVMIVEDDKFILKAMNFKFMEAGFDVKLCTTAESGLKLLETWKPDVIILDILLPGIDGYAFLRTIKNHPEWKTVPVIIASNLDEDEESDTGADDYIVKSDLDLDELVKRARSHIN